jgi:hypothetical protein
VRARCVEPESGLSRRPQARQQAAFEIRPGKVGRVANAGFDPIRIRRNSSYSSCSSIENGVVAISTGEPGPGVAGLGDFNTRPLKLVFSHRFLSVPLSVSMVSSGLYRSMSALVLRSGRAFVRHAPIEASERLHHRAKRTPRFPSVGPSRTHAGSPEPQT